MRILIDIGHPGHVHLLKNLFFELNSIHKIWVTVKDIPIAIKLLEHYGIPYLKLGSKKDNIIGKAFSQIHYNYLIYNLVKKNNIEIGVGSSLALAHVSAICSMNSIILDDDDDEIQPLFVKFGHPFATHVLSPGSLKNNRKKKNAIFYNGFHELAYLSPNKFTPDINILKELNLDVNEKFFVLRFNRFMAHHDIGHKGISLEQKLRIIRLLENYGRIFITTEGEIEPELIDYQLTINPEKIHSLLAFSQMFIGDSQTMTSEAAVLGIPAVKCNSFAGKLSVPNELEDKYNLCFSFQPDKFDAFLNKIREILEMPNRQEEWEKRRLKMLKEKIDVSNFLIWLISNYPKSITSTSINSDLLAQFRLK
jgi:predicted glycosyltransferase